MLRRLTTVALLTAAFALPAPAWDGSCSTLDIDTVDDGTNLTITVAVTGSLANEPIFIGVGQTVGSSTFSFGSLGSLTMCLDSPFAILPLGLADANGDASASFAVPSGTSLGVTFQNQAAALAITIDTTQVPPIVLDTCTSNVAALSL